MAVIEAYLPPRRTRERRRDGMQMPMLDGVIETYGLTHIHLVVRDVARSLIFYGQMFGMEELFREGDDLVFLRTPGTRDMVTLNEDPERPEPGQSGGIAHFGFRLRRASDMDQVVAEVEAAGGTLLRRGEHAPGELYAYISDPDGYTIELDAAEDTG